MNGKPAVEFKLSKKQMKKIHLDGHFGDKNKIFFDEQGRQVTSEEMKKSEFETNLRMLEEIGVDPVDQYARKIEENKEEIEEHEAERIRQKRLKKKLRNKESKENGKAAFYSHSSN